MKEWLGRGRDAPLPVHDDNHEHLVTASGGRVLFKNTYIDSIMFQNETRNGPAMTDDGDEGCISIDKVYAFPCKSWPPEGREWLNRPAIGDWPSEELKRLCDTTGFFVVGVGSRDSEAEETEWRVSTSMAERYLMFSLNITQLSCYVLMKMILKTFIKPNFTEETLTSFMCKTVLFHCVATTKSDVWKEHNLLPCLIICLHMLQNFIRCGKCPHFIILQNNLLRGKLTHLKRIRLLGIIQTLIDSHGRDLNQIQIDGLGQRLQIKLNIIPQGVQDLPSSNDICVKIKLLLAFNFAINLDKDLLVIQKKISSHHDDDTCRLLVMFLVRLANYCASDNNFVRSSCSLLIPHISTTLGSVLASMGIHLDNTIPPASLTWFSLGVNSDVSSGRLKLASAFYCVGDMGTTEVLLRDVEQRYNMGVVQPVCECWTFISNTKQGFSIMASERDVENIKDIFAYCVRFLPCEINCVPVDLQYEMFRSTREDLPHRGKRDYWMDWAVVDSLPYLYFLRYKTYSQLGRYGDRQLALDNLIKATCGEIWVGQYGELDLGHRETAWNLIGQCMEQENRPQDALQCYANSLHIRARNNAAKWHICKLLYRLVNNRVQ